MRSRWFCLAIGMRLAAVAEKFRQVLLFVFYELFSSDFVVVFYLAGRRHARERRE